MLGYQTWRCMKHNLIPDFVEPRRFLKIFWENFLLNNLLFFFLRGIIKGPNSNLFSCKLCTWVIFIILFTRIPSRTRTTKGAKPTLLIVRVKDCFIKVESHVTTSWIMMTQPSTTMMKVVTFLSYSVFEELHYLKKPWRNLETFESSL